MQVLCSINSPVLFIYQFNFIVFPHFTLMSNSIPSLRKWPILKKTIQRTGVWLSVYMQKNNQNVKNKLAKALWSENWPTTTWMQQPFQHK